MSVPCLFAIEFGVIEFWLCRSVLKRSINKRNQNQGLPIDISVQLQACFCSYIVLPVQSPWTLGSCPQMCPLGALCLVCGVLGHLAPVHRCARSVLCVACAVSWGTWLLFTGVLAWGVVLRVRCPGPLCSYSPVCSLGACVACAVSWTTWLLLTSVLALCVVLRVWCPGPPGSCSPVCSLRALRSVCGVLGNLAPVDQCARSVRCVVCAVSWVTWLLFPCLLAPCVVLRCLCGVLGHLAPVHRCALPLCCVACAVSWATWLRFTGVPARCVVLRVRCPGPLGCCSPVCPFGVLCSVCGPRDHLAPVLWCALSVRGVACAVSWTTSLLFTAVPARCVALRVRCPGQSGSCSSVCSPAALCCLCGVLGHLGPVHRCARPVRCVVCAVSLATRLLFTAVLARCVVLHVQCPGPLGSCSPVCSLGALCCVCGVLGHLAPIHRCARLGCCVACAVSWTTWLLLTSVLARCIVLCVRCPGPLGSCSPLCPVGVLCRVCGPLGHWAPVLRCACLVRCVACAVSSATWLFPHRCARLVRCVACAVSWASCSLFTGVLARCVVLRLWCPGPLGSCSLVCSLAAMCCMCGVLGHLAFSSPLSPLGALCCVCGVLGQLLSVHRCARSVRCVASVVSWTTWLLFTSVLARCDVLHVRCPRPLGFFLTVVPAWCVLLRVRCPGAVALCSPVCSLGALCCVCRVLDHLAPVNQCARSVRCVACAVFSATWLLFTAVPAQSVVSRVRCPGPLGSAVLQCARSVRCVACAVSWATWLLFTAVLARCVVLRVRCPWPLGSCSPVCSLGVLCCVFGVLGHLAPVHRCARSVHCVSCAVSWATWLLFTGVPARCVVLCVWCPGQLGFCSPVCLLCPFFCVCGVLGHLAPVHRCARSVRCVACSVSWATWLLFTAVLARCVVFRVLCPGPLGSCSPVCPLGALFCVCGVLGHLAPVHQCARSVCCVACAVSWATWLVFTAVLARCVVLRVRSPGPLGSRSPVCSLAALRCVCGVLGHLASVHRCARSVRCVACAVSWTTWLLFTAVLPRSVVLRVGCPGPIGSCSTVCSLGVLCCVCGVLGHLAPVHRCACSVRSFVCAVSWATWLLFTVVLVFGTSCSTVCWLGALCCVFGVLGHLAPVHWCACSVRCVAFAVSWATWLLFTGVPARCVVSLVRCPGPLGSCSPLCSLGAWCCVCGPLGHLAPVLRCAR